MSSTNVRPSRTGLPAGAKLPQRQGNVREAVNRAFDATRAIEKAICVGAEPPAVESGFHERTCNQTLGRVERTAKLYPRLHNAMWTGLVGKGSPGGEPHLDLDSMLDLTAGANVDGVKFEGVDLFLFSPHVDIDISDDRLDRLAAGIARRNLVVGSLVAPVWFDASAMGNEEQRWNWVNAVRKACRIAQKLREIGIRSYGVVRIDSAASVGDWARDPARNTKLIAQTFREGACIASDHGERLAAEGEICWGGMHSWRAMVDLLEETDRPDVVGFQADMAHTLLYALGYNAEQDGILPVSYDWKDQHLLDGALAVITKALRPWTIDFHVAQNDATVKGSGMHDKTGRHCLVNDPNAKLNIPHHAGYWLRDEAGELSKSVNHICWDGCSFPNEIMLRPQTWNDILAMMIATREAHGWNVDV